MKAKSKSVLAPLSAPVRAARAAGLVAPLVVDAPAPAPAPSREDIAAAGVRRLAMGARVELLLEDTGSGSASVFVGTVDEVKVARALARKLARAAAAADSLALASAMADGREACRVARYTQQVNDGQRAEGGRASVVARALESSSPVGVRAAVDGGRVLVGVESSRAAADLVRADEVRAEGRQAERAAAGKAKRKREGRGKRKSKAAPGRPELVIRSGVGHVRAAAASAESRAVRLASGLGLALAAVAARRLGDGSRKVQRGGDGVELPGFADSLKGEVFGGADGARVVVTEAAACDWRGGATSAGGRVVVSSTSRDDCALAGVAACWDYAARVAARLASLRAASAREDCVLAPVPSKFLSFYYPAVGAGAVESVIERRLLPLPPLVESVGGLRARWWAKRCRARRIVRFVGNQAQAALSQLGGGLTGRKERGAVSVVSVGCPADWGKLSQDHKVLQVEHARAMARVEWADESAGADSIKRARALVWGRIVAPSAAAAKLAPSGGKGANARAACRARRRDWFLVVRLLRGDSRAVEAVRGARAGGKASVRARAVLAAASAGGESARAASDCVADW